MNSMHNGSCCRGTSGCFRFSEGVPLMAFRNSASFRISDFEKHFAHVLSRAAHALTDLCCSGDGVNTSL